MSPDERSQLIDLDQRDELVIEGPPAPEVIDLTKFVDPAETEVTSRPIPVVKRALDIVAALFGIALSSPLWLVIAVAIKLDDGGPIFYRQNRWGRGGKVFALLKFRTMIPDSDARYGIRLASENDDRITRVGRVLRAMGLDELPQFISILRGHMSFVGPRALAVGEVIDQSDGSELYYEAVPGFRKRLQVQPGLTGLATIYLPRDASPHQKLEYDLRYIEEWSIWGDLRLILVSFWISIRGKWETRQEKC